MSNSNSDTRSVPTLAAKLAQQAEEAARKQKAPSPTVRQVAAEITEDADELFLCFDKQALLSAVGPGPKNQEGIHLVAEGMFTFSVAGKEYTFTLHLLPAWARVEMLVGGGKRA